MTHCPAKANPHIDAPPPSRSTRLCACVTRQHARGRSGDSPALLLRWRAPSVGAAEASTRLRAQRGRPWCGACHPSTATQLAPPALRAALGARRDGRRRARPLRLARDVDLGRERRGTARRIPRGGRGRGEQRAGGGRPAGPSGLLPPRSLGLLLEERHSRHGAPRRHRLPRPLLPQRLEDVVRVGQRRRGAPRGRDGGAHEAARCVEGPRRAVVEMHREQ